MDTSSYLRFDDDNTTKCVGMWSIYYVRHSGNWNNIVEYTHFRDEIVNKHYSVSDLLIYIIIAGLSHRSLFSTLVHILSAY